MITAADLKSQTVKDLAQMARNMGLAGWHSMRKDQLVRALVRATKAKAKAKTKAPRAVAGTGKAGGKSCTADKPRADKPRADKKTEKTSAGSNGRVRRKIKELRSGQQRQKDLSLPGAKLKLNGKKSRSSNGRSKTKLPIPDGTKDRIVLLVRDAYWLQACWDVTRRSVERARAAMAEHWHTAQPVLRLLEVETGPTTSTAERHHRDIEIHGGVKNWYIDITDSPKSFRVDLSYRADSGRFHALARSNTVTTPSPGSSDAIDENWMEVAENYEKIYAQSGGHGEGANRDLQELFEERLRRPMGSPFATRFGVGAEAALGRKREFEFNVDAELIIYGTTKSNAYVTLSGEPVKIRPDGTFTVRLSMPDKRQVLPVVATSADGMEQRTIVLAVERNTKVMEPVIREHSQ